MPLPFFAAIIFSCNTKINQYSTEKKYSIEVVDSINIDYLGNLNLMDYDSKSGNYLLSNLGMMPILEVDDTGKIVNNVVVSHEGPNAVSNPGSVGYLNGDLLIYDMEKGFVKVNDDKSISDQFKIPYQHTYLVFPPHLPLIKREDNEAFYLKPLTDADFIDGMGAAFYRNYYDKPLLEKVNVETGDITTHFQIPDQSIFKDGMNHGIYVPIIKNKGTEWLVSTWFDPIVYLFEQKGSEFLFVRAIDLGLEGMVNYESVSMENSDQFFEVNSAIRPGNVNDILLMDDYTIVVYRKGISGDVQKEIKDKFPEQQDSEIEKNDPFYAVVLDKDYNILANDVLFPLGAFYPNVINNENEIVSLKRADMFDVEEDFITLYRMKLKVE